MLTNTSPLYIGWDSGFEYFSGSIDEAAVWNTALDAATIAAHAGDNNFVLTSSAYDSGDGVNLVNQLKWNETTPTNTNLRFQIRTSADNSVWTSYMGPDGTGTSYFSNSGTGCTKTGAEATCSIPGGIAISDGASDRWFQYKAFLSTTDSLATPTLSDVTLQYVINTAPAIANITALENSSGVVNIGYDLADNEAPPAGADTLDARIFYDLGLTLNDEGGSLDTTGTGEVNVVVAGTNAAQLPASGAIMIENEVIDYTAKSGDSLTLTIADSGRGKWPGGVRTTKAVSHTNGAAVWIKAATTTGEGTVTAGTGKTATWNLKADQNNFYYGTGKVRVAVNDGNAADQVGNGQAANVVFDTKDPNLGANILILDSSGDGLADTATQSRAITLKFQNITEDSNLSVQFSNDNVTYGTTTN